MIYAIKLAMSSYKFPCAKKYSTHIIWAEIDTFNPASDCSAQCVYTLSHAYMMKIPMTYYKAPTTNFRLS